MNQIQKMDEKNLSIKEQAVFSNKFPKEYTEADLLKLIELLGSTLEIEHTYSHRSPFSDDQITYLVENARMLIGLKNGTMRW